MQRLYTSRRRRPAGHGPVRGRRQRAARRSIGTSSAARITTLAPAFGQALPTLDTVPTEYNHEVNAELLYDLGAALVKQGLGSPETWQQCGGNAVVFAQRSIMDAIGAERGDEQLTIRRRTLCEDLGFCLGEFASDSDGTDDTPSSPAGAVRRGSWSWITFARACCLQTSTIRA